MINTNNIVNVQDADKDIIKMLASFSLEKQILVKGFILGMNATKQTPGGVENENQHQH